MKWVYRILSGAVVVVGVLILAMKLFGVKALPDCDDRKTFDAVRKAVAGSVSPDQTNGATLAQLTAAVTLDDEAEVSYDRKTAIRECTGTIGLTINGKTIVPSTMVAYTLVWKDKDNGVFEVSVRKRGGGL